MEYHEPVKESNAKTLVWIKNYEVKNKTAFNFNDKEKGEGYLLLELTFTSNDYSPNKYSKFMDEFLDFLKKRGYN